MGCGMDMQAALCCWRRYCSTMELSRLLPDLSLTPRSEGRTGRLSGGLCIALLMLLLHTQVGKAFIA